ncbi:hypothetical protein BST27_11595 [Mycobacterium intermedium]|uniref:Uncharacterized protein n=2 Tax=Mycobacterium intermedium TaxID=28445 RepID=A0A1T3W489_MYCIE|nr:DUF6480 family protein [Mycobacterium intermedium]OPE49173.1 hypothetical protein BV508_15070 [Mycobacterium intermedium]ORB05912.1 hypothetical protein BST27_11595 [Mycobacterium intermedium]
MTALPPDPEPSRTPGLEAGGGVPPGSTPPDSAQTSGVSEPQPNPKRRVTPLAVVSIVGVVIFVLLFVAVAVGIVLS